MKTSTCTEFLPPLIPLSEASPLSNYLYTIKMHSCCYTLPTSPATSPHITHHRVATHASLWSERFIIFIRSLMLNSLVIINGGLVMGRQRLYRFLLQLRSALLHPVKSCTSCFSAWKAVALHPHTLMHMTAEPNTKTTQLQRTWIQRKTGNLLRKNK